MVRVPSAYRRLVLNRRLQSVRTEAQRGRLRRTSEHQLFFDLFRYCGTHFPFQPICNLWTCSRPVMCSSEGRPPALTLKQIYRRCSKWLAATCACASAHREAAPELTAVLGYANESHKVESPRTGFTDLMESKMKCARAA